MQLHHRVVAEFPPRKNSDSNKFSSGIVSCHTCQPGIPGLRGTHSQLNLPSLADHAPLHFQTLPSLQDRQNLEDFHSQVSNLNPTTPDIQTHLHFVLYLCSFHSIPLFFFPHTISLWNSLSNDIPLIHPL